MRKSTYRASADIALIKYWGKKDPRLRLPENNSVSMVLNGLDTVTTVEFQGSLTHDEVRINGSSDPKETARVVQHLDRIRERAGISIRAKVESVNCFPKGTGLSSSGSGFAALTCATNHALNMNLPQKDLSILARLASGTACRCVCGGFVEWRAGNSADTSYSTTIFPANHWDLCDVVAVVDEGMKRVPSTEGHKSAQTSPFFLMRQQHIGTKIERIKNAIALRDFTQFGEIVEAEALEFHSILLTSRPALIAWYPGTIEVMQEVLQMRHDGIQSYFTINTGFNVHVLTKPEYADAVNERLRNLSLVQKTLAVRIGDAPGAKEEHLF